VQIQVYHQGEGWRNAGTCARDGRGLRSRMREALARHGGEAVRALDSEGRVIDES
jgi:hypothetical protein